MELTFKIVVLFTCLQRLGELFLSKRNERITTSMGGKVLPERNYLLMVVLHTLWLASLIFLIFKGRPVFNPIFFGTFMALFLLGQTLRITAITTLGSRWSTRVMVLPDAPVIKRGVFKFFRHPNYLGVVIEIFALPLMAGFWEHALFFSFFNGVVLYFRIPFEERMLSEFNNYREAFSKGD